MMFQTKKSLQLEVYAREYYERACIKFQNKLVFSRVECRLSLALGKAYVIQFELFKRQT
jgi:hypothetical protein